jgi:photosystem II stability/assembly factor-like uncharacterized protein
MKKFKIYLFVVFLVIFKLQLITVNAQWISTGPDGGYVKCMTHSGSNIYAVTGILWFSAPGLYCSSDNGNTWVALSTASLPNDIRDIETLGGSLFLGTGSGVYRSDNNGFTWVEKNNGFPSGEKWINHLAVSGTTLFAAGTSSGLLRSTDNGETWSITTNGLADTYLYSLTANETAIFAGTGDQSLGVFKSTDNGNTWQQVSNGMGYYYNGIWIYSMAPMITSLSFAGTDLYAGTSENQGIWKSSDNGENWVFTGMETMNYIEITSISGDATVVLAGTIDGGVIRSVNGGVSWSVANNGIDNYGQITSFLHKEGNIFVGTKGGIYKTLDNGVNWSASSYSIRAQNITYPGFAELGNVLYVGSEGGGVFKSTNAGNTWFAVNYGLPINEWNLNALYSNQSALFAWDRVSIDGGNTWEMASNYSPGSTVNGYNGPRWMEHENYWFTITWGNDPGVYRSANNGQNWTPCNNGIPNPSAITGFNIVSNGTTLFYGTSIALFYSTNNGQSWNAGSFPNLNIHSLNGASYVSTGSSDICGLKGSGGSKGIYRSTDSGANWVQVSEFLVHKFVINGDIIFASGTNLEFLNGEWVEVPRIFRSQSDGQSWTNISPPFPGISTISLDGYGSNIFVSKYQSGNNAVYCSPDNGTSWIDISEGLNDNTYLSSFHISNGVIYAASNGNSVWKRNLDEFAPPAQPDAISGLESPCVGSTQTYSVTNVPGVTYTWQVPTDWIIVSGNGTSSITVIAGDNLGIVLVIPGNGFGFGPSQFIVVNPVLPIEVTVSIEADADMVCEGEIMTFTAIATNGGMQPTYNWFVNNEAIGANEAVFSYMPLNGDQIKLVFTSSEICALENPAESNIITAFVLTVPIVTWTAFEPDTLCSDWLPVALTGGLPEGGIYSGTGVVNNFFDPAIAGIGSHIIAYTYSDANNCSNEASIILFVHECTGINELSSQLAVYPNPVTEKLIISVKENQMIEKLELFNQLGSPVFVHKNFNLTGIYTIPVQQFPSGNYILRLTSQNEIWIKTIILR